MREAVEAATAELETADDLHASAAYRRRVASTFVRRAIVDARDEAAEGGMRVELDVNGSTIAVDVEPRRTLLDCLREDAGLKGTHAGCEHGVCGACTVLLDGEPVRSCLMLAVQGDGHAITTIEGLSPGPGELTVLQDAFCETHGLQCGYCTPGMILAGQALLARTLTPTRDDIVDAISGNICRCTGYGQIVEAIALAADRLRAANRPDGA